MSGHVPDHVRYATWEQFAAAYKPGSYPWAGDVDASAAALSEILAAALWRLEQRGAKQPRDRTESMTCGLWIRGSA